MKKLQPSDSIQVGDKLRIYWGPDNLNNQTVHVRGFVDDRIIVKEWSNRWHSWEYFELPGHTKDVLYRVKRGEQ